ncbi:MAG: type II toxin-antitoxin system PemK/MazF family toxin [Myxococcales bacterium]|nr:MAG: type II toxin-antitoxin system PemK/MazF family toxin [Myxococcales bacterium]
MRAIHLVHLDKTRPAVVLTREPALAVMSSVTVAPITSTIRGISTEVPLGRANGLDHECVASCDNLHTIPQRLIGRFVGALSDDQERALAEAIVNAFDLRVEELD